MAAAPLLLCGCAAAGAGGPIDIHPAPAPPGGRTAIVEADWNDVYAAAVIALPKIEAAELGTEGLPEAQSSRITIRLKTIRDREGVLIAERLAPPPPPSLPPPPHSPDSNAPPRPEPIRLTARIGPTGDPETEDRLLRATAARLRQLAGKDWAPLP